LTVVYVCPFVDTILKSVSISFYSSIKKPLKYNNDRNTMINLKKNNVNRNICLQLFVGGALQIMEVRKELPLQTEIT
jgi:hypothetical protein